MPRVRLETVVAPAMSRNAGKPRKSPRLFGLPSVPIARPNPRPRTGCDGLSNTVFPMMPTKSKTAMTLSKAPTHTIPTTSRRISRLDKPRRQITSAMLGYSTKYRNETGNESASVPRTIKSTSITATRSHNATVNTEPNRRAVKLCRSWL